MNRPHGEAHAPPRDLHLLAEARRRGFVTRNAHLGDLDSDSVDVPIARLTSARGARRTRRP